MNVYRVIVRNLIFWVAVLGLNGGGCSSGGMTGDPGRWRSDFLRDLGEHYVIPLYQSLAKESLTLKASTEQFCSRLSESSFGVVRGSWQITRSLLKQAEVFALGPYTEYPWRIGPKLDLWPVRPGEIEETLMTERWKETGDLSLVTGFSKGMPAMEYLLYADDAVSADSAYQRLVNDERACVYLRLIAADIADNAQALYYAWASEGDNYLQELTNAGNGSLIYTEEDRAFSEVINRLGFTVENMREIKVAKPAGFRGNDAETGLLESHFSSRSLGDLRDNLKGISSVYFGSELGPAYAGLQTLIERSHAYVDAEMERNIKGVEDALNGFEESLKDAIENNSNQPRVLYDALKQLQKTIQVELSQHLAVNVTFNDTDGD